MLSAIVSLIIVFFAIAGLLRMVGGAMYDDEDSFFGGCGILFVIMVFLLLLAMF